MQNANERQVKNELGNNDAGSLGREKEWNEGAEVIKSGELSPETSTSTNRSAPKAVDTKQHFNESNILLLLLIDVIFRSN
jgi:hypothetical protein